MKIEKRCITGRTPFIKEKDARNKCVLLVSSPTNAMPVMKKTTEWIRIGKLFSDLEKDIGSPVDFELPESFNKSKRLTTRSLDMAVRASIVADESQPAVVQKKISESPRVLRSSSKGKDSCRKRARTEKCSNDDDDEVVRTVEWVHNAEKIVGNMRERLASNAINHQLLLRVEHSENELQTCKSKASETNQKPEERARTRSLQKLEELEKSLNESYSKNVELKMRLDESNSRLKKAREESVKAFMKSNTYKTLVNKRAALHEYQGFSKCLQQAMKLAAFRKDFNMSLLDPFKNEKSGKDPIIVKDEVDVESEGDEFAFLLKHLDWGD